MILVIDAGNTRLKWGVCAGAPARSPATMPPGVQPTAHAMDWIAVGALDRASIDRLPEELDPSWSPSVVVASNVAGEAVAALITRAVSRWPVPLHWVRSERERCGVRNGYEQPERLGTDRWVALIGAWHRVQGPCLVVNCGTATTLDLLDAEGRFTGGAILPGLELMKRSLATNTAQLALLAGRHAAAPRNTADAIETGCLDAQAGAIERMHRRGAPGARCIMSGGAAEHIAPLLPMPVESVPHLTLEGLAIVAGSLPPLPADGPSP